MTRPRLALLAVLVACAFFANAGALEANIMEARNLVTAREMLEKGNWLVPTMNGELRFEKPPLPTWATAVAMRAFGQERLGLLRLPAALAGVLLVFFLYRLARELTEDEAIPFLAAATAATSFYVLLMARDVSWDVFTHAFMLGAIWQLHRGLSREGRPFGPFAAAGVLMGLSFLSKGPVAFYAMLLPYLLARTFAFGTAPWRGKGRPVLAMAAIALAIGAAWPVAIGLLHPEVATFVARKEAGAWLDRNVRPFWRYFSFPVQSGVWTVLATAALVVPYARKRVAPFGDRNYRLLAAWVFVNVFLLSLFPEKKERYLFPVLLPLAALTAFYVRGLAKAFRDGTARRADAVVVGLQGGLMALAGAALPVVVWALVRRNGFEPDPRVAIAGAAVCWPIAFLLVRAAVRREPLAVWGGTAALMAATCLVLVAEAPKIVTTNPQYRPYHELRRRPDLAGLPFFRVGGVRGKFIEVVWASGREIAEWDPASGALPAPPPFVLMTPDEPSAVLGPALREVVELEELGRFDAVQGRSGRDTLRNWVTVVRPKARLTGR